MLKNKTPSFVRFLILLFMAVLLELFTLPTNSPCSTDKGSRQDAPKLTHEQLHHKDKRDRPTKPARKVIAIQQGDHFSGLLEKAGLSPGDALYVSKKANKVFKLNRMRPGSELELYFTPDGTGLQEVDYKVNDRKRVVLYNGRVIEKSDRTATRVSGSSYKQSTLAPSTVAAGKKDPATGKKPSSDGTKVPPKSSMQAAQEPTGKRPVPFEAVGDGIRMLASYDPVLFLKTTHPLQETYSLLSDGKILSPVMMPWDPDARSENFTKPGTKASRNPAKTRCKVASSKGKSSKKTRLARNTGLKKHSEDGFLKAPLTYRCISSGYTNRRIHPITNTAQPHYGIDYAAPRGTPVHSIGSGTVIYAGWDGGFGKTIRVRHKNGYVSHYGHLSRYAKSIRAGRKIKRGETIGFVGMTGTATGPHLDFRVTYHGNFINPAKLEQHFKKMAGHTLRKTQG